MRRLRSLGRCSAQWWCPTLPATPPGGHNLLLAALTLQAWPYHAKTNNHALRRTCSWRLRPRDAPMLMAHVSEELRLVLLLFGCSISCC